MMSVVMQQEERLVHHGGTDSIIQLCHDDQILFSLLRLNFHMLQEFHGEAAHQPQQVFHRQDECNPNLDQSNHSSLTLFQAHKAS